MMLCVTRNSVSFLGLGCFQQGLKSRRVRRIMVLTSCGVRLTRTFSLATHFLIHI